jgi:hypothetical protein
MLKPTISLSNLYKWRELSLKWKVKNKSFIQVVLAAGLLLI